MKKTNSIVIKKSIFASLIIVLVSVAAVSSFFVGLYITNLDSDRNMQFGVNNAISKVESQTEANPIVAEINGREIRLGEVKDVISAGISQGQPLDNSAALDMIITKVLLLEEAQNRNITITMDEAKKEMSDMYSQQGLSQEKFEEKLEELGTTYNETLEIFREEMIINKMLINEVTDVEIQISDDEVKNFFDENIDMIKAQAGNNTVFEDISSQLKANLIQQKQQKMALDFIESLEQKATIITYKENFK